MSQIPDLPEIQIVDTESMQLHEDIDEARSQQLVQLLQSQGFLKNPPVVWRMDSESEKYVVLDGANRTMAVRQIGLPHMLVQIADDAVEVRSWNHILSEGDMRSFLENVRKINGVNVSQTIEFRAAEAPVRGESLAYMVLPDGETWQLEIVGESIADKQACLTELVSLYEGRFRRDRTTASNMNGLSKLYPDMNCLIVFPQFSVDDVVEIAMGGQLLPSGVTRFVISPRALRMNFPLAMLADQSPVEDKRLALAEWIHQRVEQRRVRFYAESTFVFDE
ncbi:MAG: hypothetical protein ACE5JF_06440 [Anaerolineales bacterium]